MADIESKVPDIGGHGDVPVIEILVAVGDTVKKDQGLVTLESDKATMEVPAIADGVVKALKVKLGDVVSEGALIAVIAASDSGTAVQSGAAASPPAPVATATRAEAAAPGPAPAASPAPATPAPQAAASSGRTADIDCALVVIGAGPGGYTAAFRAADLGLDTVLIERYPSLGGVCLNVGCIPSKALLHAADVIDQAAHASDFGVDFGKPKINIDTLRGYKEKVVGQLTKGLAGMARQRKVRVVQGTAKFVSANELEISVEAGVGADGKAQLLHFANCIIAAGSQPVKLPSFPWDDARVMDSTDALDLADVPKKLLVVGGGIIGLEMATVYRALGSEVTVVEFMPQLMPGADLDLVKPLADRLKKHGIAIHLKTKVVEAKAQKNGIACTFEGESIPDGKLYDRVLVSVGRAPNGGKLDAGKAGVEVTERGFIDVDRQMRTNVPHIFAIGDLVGQPMLAHKATHEGKLAAEVAAGEKKEWVARVIPSVAYTDPEIAWVGVTETEAKAKGLKVGVGKFPWAASGRAIGLSRTEGFTKLIFDEDSHRIIGGGIVGVHAGDLIAEIGLAIEMGCEVADIGHTIHPHPTLSESVGMAAEVFDGSITDLYIPRKR
ncbi:dihydrolipoyl dehydrogenase [Thermomonas sp.]|jgi:dihydrolipoamide dehydrogenase|uniref:dihydrolipoyl dehydrogenase n=1 Tax=Thermomonas sp. TaxID=1971895 RepID=UPI0026123120|nr:dihydrolipoyl dehydrogenase [Thermomonas sp.]MBL0229010.1 dihydrolipoyl dehydrogenase [Thermomonas sp.]HQW58976.1 dihydrolipoyl dehydrogenase [Thermomonas sp.]HQY83065.1 dihydrolipoyl dehydrogenase [Thermomonas sp.]